MVNDGQTAKIHLKATLDDGSVLESSEGKEPLTFEIGSGQVLPGLENAVRDMDVGETRTVRLDRTDAYGDVRDELIAVIPKERFPDDVEPEMGMALQVQTNQGVRPAKVVGISDEGVKIDANHPLAGKDVTFKVSLLDVA